VLACDTLDRNEILDKKATLNATLYLTVATLLCVAIASFPSMLDFAAS